MFKKLNNKKGFTLIEMMAVVAIIAVLVSIVMPVFGESKNKANAATNAANLRTVEGQLASLLVTNPEVFEKQGADAAEAFITETFNAAIEFINDLTEVAEIALDLAERFNWFGQNNGTIAELRQQINDYQQEVIRTQIARDHAVDMAKYSFTAVDGVIELNGVTIAAPQSQALNVDDVTLEKGIEMTVYVTDTRIYASYDGILSSCFAIVAEQGSSAQIGEGAGAHEFTDNDGDYICDYCGNNDSH